MKVSLVRLIIINSFICELNDTFYWIILILKFRPINIKLDY